VAASTRSLQLVLTVNGQTLQNSYQPKKKLSASITQNCDNAKVTDGMATKPSSEATDGGQAVSQTVTAMKQMAASGFRN
jgi:methyl-accepting chemotaxis protein